MLSGLILALTTLNNKENDASQREPSWQASRHVPWSALRAQQCTDLMAGGSSPSKRAQVEDRLGPLPRHTLLAAFGVHHAEQVPFGVSEHHVSVIT